MFLYAAEPRHDHEAVHLQLSDMVASGRLGDAIRAAGVKLSDIHLVAFEPVGDHMPHEGISGRPSWHPSLMLCTCIGQQQVVLFICCVGTQLSVLRFPLTDPVSRTCQNQWYLLFKTRVTF